MRTRVEKLSILIPVSYSLLGVCLLMILLIALTFKFRKMKSFVSFTLYSLISIIAINLRDVNKLYFGSTYGISTTVEVFLKCIYFTKVECNYIESAISLILTCFARWTVGMKFSQIAIPELTMMSVMIIGIVFFSYTIEKGEKICFCFEQKLKSKNEWLKSTLDNIQNGLLVMDEKRITYFNEFVLKNLKFLLELEDVEDNIETRVIPISSRVCGTNENNEMIPVVSVESEELNSKILKKYYRKVRLTQSLLRNLEQVNQKLPQEVIQILSSNNTSTSNSNKLSEVLRIMSGFQENFTDFVFIGTKKFEEEGNTNINTNNNTNTNTNTNNNNDNRIYLEIFLRIVEKSNSNSNSPFVYEFIFNDVTRSKVTEEVKAQIKYKSMFLAKVAHEFKNPLIIIKELVDQIIEELPSIYNTQDIFNSQTMIDNLLLGKNLSSYLLILVKDFEVVSKKENSSKIELIRCKFDLREEMSYLEQIVQTLISKKYGSNEFSPIRFTLQMDDEVPDEIMTDRTRLSQILINLISNSVKFTQNGEITLKIQFCNLSNKLKFTVTDTGAGIPESEVKNLFKYFYKSNDNNNIHGSGLGLSIVKELCVLLGGDIEYTPNTPRGSTFSFEISYWDDSEDSKVFKESIRNKSERSTLNHFHRVSPNTSGVYHLRNRYSPHTRQKYYTHKINFRKFGSPKGTINNNNKGGTGEYKSNKDYVTFNEGFNINTNNNNNIFSSNTNSNVNNPVISFEFPENKSPSKNNNNMVDISKGINYEIEDECESNSDSSVSGNNNNNESDIVDRTLGPVVKFSPNNINLNRNDSMITEEMADTSNNNSNNNVNNSPSTNNRFYSIDSKGVINIANNQISQLMILHHSGSTGFIPNLLSKSNFYFSFNNGGTNNTNNTNNIAGSKYSEDFVNRNLNIKKSIKKYTSTPDLNTVNTSSANTNSNTQAKKSLTIILADDEVFIRSSIIRQIDKYLNSLKINLELIVIEVNDGIECLYSVYSALQQNIEIDLIISDETMKYMTGSIFAETFNKIFGVKIPIAIVTAYEDHSKDSKYSSPAVIGVFSKPVNFSILHNIFLYANIILS